MKKILIICGLVCVLAGCGQYNPPEPSDVQQKIEPFTLDLPDGRKLDCVMYGDHTQGLQDSKSWFSFDCDWPDEERDNG